MPHISKSLALGLPKVRCKAMTRDGDQCKQIVSPGFTVCRMHGAASPLAIEAAKKRLAEMLPEAMKAVADTVKQKRHWPSKLNAAREVLDRTIGPVKRASEPGSSGITVNLGIFGHAALTEGSGDADAIDAIAEGRPSVDVIDVTPSRRLPEANRE
jgi:hypothetical protein